MKRLFTTGEISISLLTDEAARERLRYLFARVASEQGWKADDEPSESGRSLLFAVFVGEDLAGGIEICPASAFWPLPLFATWPELADETNDFRCAELALLALAKEHRGSPRLLWTLCVEVWRYCLSIGIDTLYAAVPPRNLRIYKRIGWALEVVGEARDHWGEPCYPCRLALKIAERAVLDKIALTPSLGFVREQGHRS